MANKRVSMKGRGADLFFGDYTPAGAGDVTTPSEMDEPVAESPPPLVGDTDEVVGSKPVALVELPTVTATLPKNRRIEQPDASVPFPAPASDDLNMLASKQAGMKDGNQVEVPESIASPTQASIDAFELASTLAGSLDGIDAIRRAVREPGREVAYVRLTPKEKGLVGDVVHAYKKRGQRTTENELHRIAINHLLQDHHEHGEDSVLARVLASLRA